MQLSFKNLTIPQLKDAFSTLGEPSFRWKQVLKWVYQKRVDRFDQMSNVSKKTRQVLAGHFRLFKLDVSNLLISRKNDAAKFGFRLRDNAIIESVLLYDKNRRTACISSQLGCGLGCTFCETGKMGFFRNLSQEEILGQLIGINDYLESRGDKLLSNIVFMGMGEALSNYANFRAAVEIIMDENGFCFGGRKITVSTAGVVPSIKRLMKENLNLGLAISLNSWNNKSRSRIMPVNRKYPIETLIKIAQEYFQTTGRRVTFEYVVIEGHNDGNDAVEGILRLLNGVTCKINLIPANPCSAYGDISSSERKISDMAQKLSAGGINATIRKSRGRDICGACGQLSSTESICVYKNAKV
ncbi:MAG: 23S rRNA (adenine(2503)-C(2))-methyltransferase RlmN [Chitinivibrionales bacterium]|nr:23S rRNA (adenine(2503)-C(2))-methyltransferase RlmN [Chitinivibrionales bacterium]